MLMVVDISVGVEKGGWRAERGSKCRQGMILMVMGLEMAKGGYHDGSTSDDNDT